ncbi:MAG: ABC-F family ATP-binding cassette domain-containing protein, partial [Desulfatitalea sp.]|nr:ATP-binding cassette domain-containing protein [Desulfatitalea sp.]NNK00061.1 ABC-F family ATP-binding cassette domain-containing protein [Desulfatitalea sp.]
VCIIGPNGKGKTTLLKLISSQLKPLEGDITFHPGVASGFYEQTNIQTLNDHNTIETEIMQCHPDVGRQQARNICGAMLFEGDNALKRISVLSGGEKARVMLGKLLATPLNLVLLDEPSNHLDMESCDALLAAMDDFAGALIMVTHNEMFLHALAQRLIVFQGGEATVFEGSYQDFLDNGGWGDDPAIKSDERKAAPDDQARQSRKDLRRLRSAIMSENARTRRTVESAIADTEAMVEQEEHRLAGLNSEMVAASQTRAGDRITSLSQQIYQCQVRIDETYTALESLYSEKEALDAELTTKLAQIGEG